MSLSAVCLKFSKTSVRSSRLLSFVSMFLTDDSITSSFFSFSKISSRFPAKFCDISNAVQISSSSSTGELIFLVILFSGEETESSELADVLFLLLQNNWVIISVINNYREAYDT